MSDEVCVVSEFGARCQSLRQEAMLSAQLMTNETLSLWLACEVEVMNSTRVVPRTYVKCDGAALEIRDGTC